MRILHTSDWHLGKVLHERSLLGDQAHVLAQIADFARRERHDAMVIAGDIFERSVPPPEAVTLLDGFWEELKAAAPEMTVFVIPGNHDSRERLGYGRGFFAKHGVYVGCDIARADAPVTVKSNGETADFYLIPFLSPGIVEGAKGEEDPSSQAAMTRAVVQRIGDRRDPGRLNVLVAHLFTEGGSESKSERPFVGTMSRVPAGVLDGFDYTALGHLHKPQEAGDRIRYSGSPLKYSFSEANDEKVMLSVTLERGACRVDKIPLAPKTDVVRVRGRFEELLRDERFLKHKNSYLEATLNDPALVPNAYNMLVARFPNLLSVQQDAAVAAGIAGSTIATREGTTPVEDFAAFHRHVYDEPPDPAESRMFAEGLKRLEKGEQ